MAAADEDYDEDNVPQWMLSNQLYKDIVKAFEITPDDIAKELNEDELKLLCQRVRCRVDMWKYNPVDDFASHFRETGRFIAQPQEFINKLLLKAYRARRHYFKAVEDEKEKSAELEWQKRKKMSLLRLNQWRYDEEQRLRDSEIETVVAPEYEPLEIVESEETCVENLQEENTEGSAAHVPALVNEFQVCINSESMTIDTQLIGSSESVSQVLDAPANNVSLNASQMLDDPIMPSESEAESQEVDYNGFQEYIPLASTQDRVC